MADRIIVNENKKELQTVSTKEIAYQIGNGEMVVLNEQIIRNLTNNDTKITASEIQLFIEMCKYQHLNPLIKEAYLIKLDERKPAQQVVALGAFMRIADESSTYEGLEDGIIVQNKNGEIVDRVGCVKYAGELLIGGWAKVYRSDRKFPFIARVDLKEYSKGQATWNQLPMVMINKVAKVSALRKAFPQSFNGMYVAEEIGQREDCEETIPTTPVVDQSKVYDIHTDDYIVDDNSIKIEVDCETNGTEIVPENTKDIDNKTVVQNTTISDSKNIETQSDIFYVKYSEYVNNPQKYEKAGEYDKETKRLPVKVKEVKE